MKLFETLLDFDIQLVAEYTGDIVNGYELGSVTINGTKIELSPEQKEELFEAIHEHDLFFEEEEIQLLDE